MSDIDLRSVIIQELYYSKHAKHRYRLAPQRRGIGTIDLSYIMNDREFYKHWMYFVGQRGKFSLLSRDKKGRLRKCIGMITVTKGSIKYKDNRCALCTLMRSRSYKKPEDMRI